MTEHARAEPGGRSDRRRLHGARTRHEILGAALEVAAREGLEALSIGRLAADVGMSKAGLFGHFGSKEALQIATIDAAWEIFRHDVLEPTEATGAGAPQLREFLERYFAYVQRRSDKGGCFFTAVSSEFDDREGPVRDRIGDVIALKDSLIERVLEAAVRAGHFPAATDVTQMRFEIVWLVTGANLAFQLSKDRTIFDRARAALRRLAPPLKGERRSRR